MLEPIQALLIAYHFEEESALRFAQALLLSLAILVSIIANYISKRFILQWLSKHFEDSVIKWQQLLLEHHIVHRLVHLVPAVVLYLLAPLALIETSPILAILLKGIQLYFIINVLLILDTFLNITLKVFENTTAFRDVPLKGFIQVAKLILYSLALILVISIIFNRTPLYLLSGVGALTAILLLVFRDAILGFVAGIQLMVNQMVKRGDWIEMPKYNADGEVQEVALTTVKVQNWDKTITTIPTYSLISESFKNWRGMEEFGGRRIKRSIFIDLNTIRFCTYGMLIRLNKQPYLKPLIDEYPIPTDADPAEFSPITNLTALRTYIEGYLTEHDHINNDMTFIIRELAPTSKGLPLEIYVFCSDITWKNYEKAQADIMDHLMATVPFFGLRLFQEITGSDIPNS